MIATIFIRVMPLVEIVQLKSPIKMLQFLKRTLYPYPPAIAPRIINGSAPDATASGNGVSGDS